MGQVARPTTRDWSFLSKVNSSPSLWQPCEMLRGWGRKAVENFGSRVGSQGHKQPYLAKEAALGTGVLVDHDGPHALRVKGLDARNYLSKSVGNGLKFAGGRVFTAQRARNMATDAQEMDGFAHLRVEQQIKVVSAGVAWAVDIAVDGTAS